MKGVNTASWTRPRAFTGAGGGLRRRLRLRRVLRVRPNLAGHGPGRRAVLRDLECLRTRVRGPQRQGEGVRPIHGRARCHDDFRLAAHTPGLVRRVKLRCGPDRHPLSKVPARYGARLGTFAFVYLGEASPGPGVYASLGGLAILATVAYVYFMHNLGSRG